MPILKRILPTHFHDEPYLLIIIHMAQDEDFPAYARNPDVWMFAARRALAVAELLMDHYRASLHASAKGVKRDIHQQTGCLFAGYFHAGLAIENVAKAVLVTRDPTIVEKGRVNIKKFRGGRSGHKLLGPVKSILGSLTDEEHYFLTKLEGFVWAGRYAVPKKADELYDREKMSTMSQTYFDERAVLRSLFERLSKQIKGAS